MIRKYILIFFLITLIVRASTWLLPLQRDAIGYAYNGREIVNGAVLYRDMWDHKPPGIYFLNAAVYKISFPVFIQSLRFVSMFASFLAALALFFVLRQYFSERISAVTTILFSIFSNVYFLNVGDNLVEGYMLPVLVFLYYAIIQAYRTNHKGWYFITGICLGILFLFKQIGILPFGAIGLFLFLEKKYKAIAPLILIAIGTIIALIPFAAYIVKNNIASETFDAVFLYNMVYSQQPLEIRSIGQSLYYAMQVILATLLFWVFAATGALQKKYSRLDVFFLLLFFASFIGVTMGGKFAFTRHYFLLLFPSLSYFVAKALREMNTLYSRRSARVLLSIGTGAILFPSIIMQGQAVLSGLYYTGAINLEKKEMQYLLGLPQYNFVEEQKVTQSVAKYLQRHLAPGDRILNWGAEPELYVYTNTSSPSRYYYNFPLNGIFIKGDSMLPQRRLMFMKELEKDKPMFIIVNNDEGKHQVSFAALEFDEFKTFLGIYYMKDTEIGSFIIFKRSDRT